MVVSRMGWRGFVVAVMLALTTMAVPEMAITAFAQGVVLPAEVSMVQASPANPDVIYAVSGTQVYRSLDRGSTWEQVSALPSRVRSLAPSLNDPDRVYAGTESRGLWRTLDGGRTWHESNNGLNAGPGAVMEVSVLAVDREDDMVIYAAAGIWLGTAHAHLTPTQIAFTIDGGANWLPLKQMVPGDSPITGLAPVEGLPLSVMAFNAEGYAALYQAGVQALMTVATSKDEAPERQSAAAEALSMLREPEQGYAIQASAASAPDRLPDACAPKEG